MSTSSLILILIGIYIPIYNRNHFYLHPTKDIIWKPKTHFTSFNLGGIDNWFFQERGIKTNRILIYCPGNSGNMSHLSNFITFWKSFLSQEYSLLTFNYIGFGTSVFNGKSTPSIQNCVFTLKTILNFFPDTKNITLYGFSLGGSIIIETLANYYTSTKFHKIIISNTFTSLRDMVSLQYPLLSYLVPNELDTLENLKKLHMSGQEITLLHSKEDEIIPFHMSLRLKPFAKSFFIIKGLHNNIVFDKNLANIIL